MIKRIALSLVPTAIAALASAIYSYASGNPFPPGPILLGAILSYLVYQFWDEAYQGSRKAYHTGKRAYRAVKAGWTVVTEEKQPPPQAKPKIDPITTSPVKHDAPTEPFTPDDIVTGHLVPTEDYKPLEDTEDPAFIIGKTEPSRPGAGDGRTIELDEISSLGVGGVPGSGKTVSMVGLATQSVVKYKGDVRFLLVDPHMNSGSGDALSARMAPLAPFYLQVPGLPNPVFGGSDLVKWISWLRRQAKDRIAGKVAGGKLVLMADEFTALLDDPEISEPLTELLLLINEQSRKVGIFALLASPAWKSSRIQGTDVRNTIASFLVHHMPPNIARQLLPYEEAEKANRLAKGQAIFSSFGVVETVRVPLMTSSDIERCIKPYLPVVEEKLNNTVSGRVGEEPTIAEVRSIWETYMILNQELHYEEDSAIRALAIDVYGPGDPQGIEKVKKALKLGEEHL